MLENIASGAISGLAFGTGGTAVNRSNVNDRYGAPDVIAQTGKDKNVPTETSLHLADGQVRGLPMVEKTVETVQELPRVEQTSGQTATEPKGLPMVEKENTAGQSQTVKKEDAKSDQRSIVVKLQENIPALQNEPVLREVQGTEFDKSQGKLTDTAGAFFKAIGNKVFRKGLGNVILDERSIRSDIAHGIGKTKAATFAAVPDVIEKGKQIDYDQNWKGRGEESFVYAGKVTVDKKPAYLAAVVLRGTDSRFYLHEVVDENGNVIYARKDASTGVQDRGDRKNGDTGASVASPAEGYQVSGALAPDQTSETALELPSNSSIKENVFDVKPSGLPIMRQESLQDALQASVTGGRTLGDNERRTGAPIPSTVESQLQALQELTADMDEDTSSVANIIRKYVGEDAANYWLEHGNETQTEEDDLSGRPTPEHSGAVTDEEGNVIGTEATAKLGVKVEGGIADLTKVQKAREAQWGLDVTNRQIAQVEKDLRASAAEKRMAENVAKGIDTLDSYQNL